MMHLLNWVKLILYQSICYKNFCSILPIGGILMIFELWTNEVSQGARLLPCRFCLMASILFHCPKSNAVDFLLWWKSFLMNPTYYFCWCLFPKLTKIINNGRNLLSAEEVWPPGKRPVLLSCLNPSAIVHPHFPNWLSWVCQWNVTNIS